VGIVEIVASVVVMVKKMAAGAVIAAVCVVPVIPGIKIAEARPLRPRPSQKVVMVIITNRPVPIWQIRRILRTQGTLK